MFHWLRNRRRKQILAQPFPDAWHRILTRNLGLYPHLTADERERLQRLVQLFVAEKRYEGCGGLELSDEIRVTIAGQACLLLLGRDYDDYENVSEILVYPSTFRHPRYQRLGSGVQVQQDVGFHGEAHQGGPVVLSWRGALQGGRDPHDGQNVVFHEFAHKLDMLGGAADGAPPLESRSAYQRWYQVMQAEYERLERESQAGHSTLLDEYGTTNPAEFFAVVTEAFFERPRAMRHRHPALYQVMKDFFAQDPAARIAD